MNEGEKFGLTYGEGREETRLLYFLSPSELKIRYEDNSKKHADLCLSCLHSPITLLDFLFYVHGALP